MVMPGEFIFKAGDKGERLFFVKKGTKSIHMRHGDIL
jgi:hypothetical protein